MLGNKHYMTEDEVILILASIRNLSVYCMDIICYLHTLDNHTFYGNYRDMARILYNKPKNSSQLDKAMEKLVNWEIVTEIRIQQTPRQFITKSVTLNKDWIKKLKQMGEQYGKYQNLGHKR